MKSMIEVEKKGVRQLKVNFIKESHGIGRIDLYYAGNFVKNIKVDLTSDMEVH